MADLAGGSDGAAAAAPSGPAGSPRTRDRRRQRAAAENGGSPRAVRRGLALILVPSVALAGIEAYSAAGLVPHLQHSQALVAQTFEVISAATALDHAMQDAERGQRGFLITGDDTYLEAYRTGVAQAPRRLQTLRRLASGSPEQQRRAARLETLIAVKLDEMKQTVAVRRQQGFEAARKIVETNLGMDAMREIVSLIRSMTETEDRLLNERQARLLDLQRSSMLFSIAAAVLSVAVMLLGGTLLVRAYRRILRSRASLQRSEERFRLLVSGVRDHAIFMLDPAGNVASWNDGAERINGYRTEEIVGSRFSRFYPAGEADPGMPERLLEAAAADGRAEAEGWCLRKDGSRFWANVMLTALHHADGSLRGFATIARDITERRQQQEALDQSRAALAQSQKMEAVGQLTGGVAHDFNNLLQTILGSIELLQSPAGPAEAVPDAARTERLLGTARRAAEQGAALTQRLLAFSRRQALSPQIVDANRLVGSISELLHRTLGEGIAIETVLAAGLWRVRVDPNQLENAILNLAVNGRDAMPGSGKLTIETANTYLDDAYAAAHDDVSPGQHVMIAVSDTGEGMTAEVVARAFEPFFTTKPEGKGTGLGLSQVHGFVKQSGGHIKLYSEPAQGTTIKIYLPRSTADGEAEQPSERLPPVAEIPAATVLLVEDDADVRRCGAEALAVLGYRVLEAADGAAALRLLDDHPETALLFTDVGLPGFNGRRLAEEATRRAPRLKVLFTTGYARNAIVHNGILDAGVDLLAKPFTVDGLGRKLQQILHGG